MKFKFKIAETIQQIITWLETTKNNNLFLVIEVKDDERLKKQNRGNYEYPVRIWRIKHQVFNSYSELILRIDYHGNLKSIIIWTAWSGFKYEIFAKNDKGDTLCEYEGAFRGLLEQNLLPTITPFFEGCELVESSLGKPLPLVNYCRMQENLFSFKKENKLMRNDSYHPHPNIVKKWLDLEVFNHVIFFEDGKEVKKEVRDLEDKSIMEIRMILSIPNSSTILVDDQELTEKSGLGGGQTLKIFS